MNNRLRLVEECLSAIEEQISVEIPRDCRLVQQVAGADATDNDFLYGGFGTSVGIRSALHGIGISLSDCERVLDFGCGPARVLRWFKDSKKKVTLYGCDINPPAIEWCKANIDFAEFSLNAAWPPLPYADHTFDLVYGISVFTHLDEPMQTAWLDELFRITKEGGIVLLTVHGDDKAAEDLSVSEHEKFKDKGFLYKAATVRATVDGLPAFYQVAFHSERYVRSAWTKQFEVLGYLTHGCMYAQDLVLLKAHAQSKPSNGIHARHAPYGIKHPLAAIETPLLGSTVDESVEESFELRGWAFHPNGNAAELDVWIDNQRIGTCVPSNTHPVVAKAFPTIPSAGRSGFCLTCSSTWLRKGWHLAWLTLRNDPTPLWANLFRCKREPWERLGNRSMSRLGVKLDI